MNELALHPDRSLGAKALFRVLGLHRKDYTQYQSVLNRLMESGQVEQKGKRRLRIQTSHPLTQGTLRLTQHGYGFVDQDDGSSVFIGAREARKAFDGDIVTVEVTDSGHASGPEGRIVRVDASSRKALLGRLHSRGSDWVAEVKTGPLNFWVRVDHGEHAAELKAGRWVLLKAPTSRTRYPLPICSILSVLGSPDAKGVAEKGLIASYGLVENYPDEAIRESQRVKITPVKKGLRQDLRHEFVITIDPADARDHDDAVSLSQDESGDYHLGVHIADVSRYVSPETAIDREACQRGFSVYLQHHHLPMLPPRLPGELCSLKPGKDRLTMSVLLRFNAKGEVLHREIIPALIRVKRLISYDAAQECLDSIKNRRSGQKKDREMVANLRLMHELAQKLNRKRLKEGGVDFDLPEPGFHWMEEAAPVSIFRQPRLDSHRLVEEFMLAANRGVAEIWAEKFGDDAPNVFRVHPRLDAEKRQRLSDYLADAGMEWPTKALSNAQQIGGLLEEARRRFPPEVFSVIARKALTLARYDSTPHGHFGLGFKRYLHFTSPIRRYADLTVHRLLWKYIIFVKSGVNTNSLKEEIETICRHLSDRERVIAEVEREAGKLAGLLYLNKRRGDVFPARLVEVYQDKFYVALEDLFIEGILMDNSGIRFRSRRSDKQRSRIRKERRSSGQGLAIGDRLMVQIARIDLLNRKLELRPV